MARNDIVLLDGIVDERVCELLPSAKRDEVFEYLALEQTLKAYDPSREELQSGWVDGGGDGGIDGFYILVNGRLVQEFETFTWPKSDATIEVFLVTAKHRDAFKQSTLDALHPTLDEIFDLALDKSDLVGEYSDKLLAARSTFFAAYKKLAGTSHILRFRIIYASRGDTDNIGASVQARADQCAALLRSLFSSSEVTVQFFGATEILSLIRKTKRTSISLPFMTYLSRSGDSYALLVRLIDYFNFVTEADGQLRRYLFDSNVRDYLGDNSVNQDIARSLGDESSPEFWWLNNGVTILATRAPILGKEIELHNVQIVNGLQTTESIFRHFSRNNYSNENSAILIKVIVSENAEIRDQIIRATNNQSLVDASSLHATEKIQRDIEAILARHDWYYERRPNYYLNEGKPPTRFVTPMYISRAFINLALRNPSSATTMRQKFMRHEGAYSSVFNEDFDLELWPAVVAVTKRVEAFLETVRPVGGASGERFLARARNSLALVAVSRILGSFSYTLDQLVSLDVSKLTDELLAETWAVVKEGTETRQKRLGPDAQRACIRAATRFGVSGDGIIGRRGPYSTQAAVFTQEFLENVNDVLPEQPWLSNVLYSVAQKLKSKPWEVKAAMDILVEQGRWLAQRDGVLYDHSGNVVGSRVRAREYNGATFGFPRGQ